MISKEQKNIIKEALEGIEYEKIILFGSRARGDNREDSDFDLMVVVPNGLTREKKMNISSVVVKRLAQPGLDCDVLVKSFEQIDYLKDKIGSVVKFIVKEGVVL